MRIRLVNSLINDTALLMTMAANSVLLITGGNAGLGFETVRSLAQSSQSYTILLGGRSLEKADAAAKAAKVEFPQSTSIFHPVQIDIEDDNSISRLFDLISKEYGRIDVLINNAGAQLDVQFTAGKLTLREMWNKSWDVNTTGGYILTYTLLPLLLRSSNPKLIFITSGTSTLTESGNTPLQIDQSPKAGWPKQEFNIAAYRSSKAGMNMMMREWVRALKEDGVKVWCISPGFLATGLGGNPELLKKMGALDPTVGADFVRDVIEGARDQDVGKAVRRAGVQPW